MSDSADSCEVVSLAEKSLVQASAKSELESINWLLRLGI